MLFKALFALFLAVFAPGSGTAGSPAAASSQEIRVNAFGNYHRDPKVAVFPDGGFVVVWTAGPDIARQVIHARFFSRDGRPASGQFRLIDRAAGSQFADQVVADRDGSFLFSWTEEVTPGGRTRVFIRRFNRDGTPRGGRLRPHAPSPFSRHRSVLALAPDGRFAVAWGATVEPPGVENYSNAVARIFTAGGAPVTGEIVVGQGEGAPAESSSAFPTGLSLRSDGTLTALFQVRESGDFLATWLVRVPAGGAPLEPRDFNPGFTCCPGDPHGSTLATGRGGGLLAVWSEYVIVAQRYSSGGQPRGGRLQVSERVHNDQFDPAAAPLAGGGYAIVWTEIGGRDGDGAGIFGRLFAANGTPSSRDRRINVTTAGHQYRPALAAGLHGPVVAAWQTSSDDGRGQIFARIVPVD